jgi:predicted nuclease of predicted toxin-antitoxin system
MKIVIDMNLSPQWVEVLMLEGVDFRNELTMNI